MRSVSSSIGPCHRFLRDRIQVPSFNVWIRSEGRVVGWWPLLLLLSISASDCIGQVSTSQNPSNWEWIGRQWQEPGDGGREVSANHLYQRVQDLIGEIEILRNALGVGDYPPEGEARDNLSPIHVYAKTHELLTKVRRVQHRLGVPAAQEGTIPFKEVLSSDVLGNIDLLIDELRKIKVQMAITHTIVPAGVDVGRNPGAVYKSLADASFLLDGLRGQPLSPDDVYRIGSYVLTDLEFIAQQFGVQFTDELPAIEGPRRSMDVIGQVLTSTRKAINLQSKLGMNVSFMPSLTLVRVTPTEVYDITNMLLAEIARIKFYLGLKSLERDLPEPNNKRPEDVYALVLLISENIDRITRDATEDSAREFRQRQDREQQREQERQAEEERQRALEEQRLAEAERERALEEQRLAEAERERALEEQRLAEAERQRELEEQRRAEEEQEEAEPAGGDLASESLPEAGSTEAALPPCDLLIAENARSLYPDYPGRGRRDYGDAVIAIRFMVDESGETIDEEVVVVREESTVERESRFDRFADTAISKVRSWSLDFADPDDQTCSKRHTRTVRFRFDY